MKTLTWTAVLAACVAIPFVLRRHKREALGYHPVPGGRVSGEMLRYDIDDLLT